MSVFGRRVSPAAVVAIAAVIVLAVSVLLTAMTTPTREIQLVARDMAFYLEGDMVHANPVIEVKAGERVRVVLRNQDQGMNHDFFVAAAAADTRLLRSNEQDEVVFEVPTVPGVYTYVCRPHQLMMNGMIKVVAR